MPEGDNVAVTLITKDSINPFFVAMQDGAKAAAEKDNVTLTIAAGKEDGDEDGQVQAIENAISRGDKGILITPNGPGVNPAITKARDAGLFVIALDTPPDPADTVDITFATDNFKAGELIGKWTAAQLGGKPATIAMLDLFNDKVVSVDYNRDQGFLTGMGIDTKDKTKNGDEDATGTYSGGNYTIACNEPTQGNQDGGKTAMESCLSKNPDINVVYTINEPAAAGASSALQAAGNSGALIVSVDGGCDGVANVASGRDRRNVAAVPGADGAARCRRHHHHRPWRSGACCHSGSGVLRHRCDAGDRQAGHRRGQHHQRRRRQDLLGLTPKAVLRGGSGRHRPEPPAHGAASRVERDISPDQ